MAFFFIYLRSNALLRFNSLLYAYTIEIVIRTSFWDNIAYHIASPSIKGRGRKNNFICSQG